jgi:hypothetical protein
MNRRDALREANTIRVRAVEYLGTRWLSGRLGKSFKEVARP